MILDSLLEKEGGSKWWGLDQGQLTGNVRCSPHPRCPSDSDSTSHLPGWALTSQALAGGWEIHLISSSTEPLCREGDAEFSSGVAGLRDKCCAGKLGRPLGTQRTCVSLDLGLKEGVLQEGSSKSNEGGGGAGRMFHTDGTACLQ